MRSFYSKGAFLIVFWTPLVTLSTVYMIIPLSKVHLKDINDIVHNSYIALILAAPFFFCAPIFGWIADTWCGNYRVFRVGNILGFLATVIGCTCSVILLQVPEHSIVSQIISVGGSSVVYIIGVMGLTACAVTAVQLGLDQMPDASSANITSFITWISFSGYFGGWLFETGYYIYTGCVNNTLTLFEQNLNSHVFSLLPVIAMTIACLFLFIFGPKWLTIEPNCPQSLKMVYQVLKFAWKHKAPLNRSALTYWEENVPSRMDLGKSRYGGPFTTEEVEDVKTFFKILIIFLPINLTFCSFYLGYSEATLKIFPTNCENVLLYLFIYSPNWIILITFLVYEVIIYPLIRNRLPSILKRIGTLSFLIFALNSIDLVLEISFLHSVKFSMWSKIPLSVLFSPIIGLLAITVLEFVCAQSPYRMRGLLQGYAIFLYLTSLFANKIMYTFCPRKDCIIMKAIFTATSLIGLVLYCLLARWYKMRVRDEEYNVHSVVEEVYDRYLSQTTANINNK